MEKSLKVIHTLQELRQSMINSSGVGGPICPAIKVDIHNFYNSCTGCVAAIKQLHAFQQATITQNLWAVINGFGDQVMLLRDEVVKSDASYSTDAPLVRCLSRLMNKGDIVLREIKSKCNNKMLDTFGEDWMNETNEKYAKDLQVVITDLSPCVSYSTHRRSERTVKLEEAKSALAKSITAKTSDAPAPPAAATNNSFNTTTGGQSQTFGSAQPVSTAIAGSTEKLLTFIEPESHQKDPEKVALEAIPHFTSHEYINLPDFTGVPEYSRPIFQSEMPPLHTTPDGETICLANRYPIAHP